ncbi:MAG TPA: hypothetical protein VGW96_03975 [Candidatus Eremiobacteraceae bacterium]|jgi:hypothetical protein|nr:hypothetical protein [Candidatus Eremiobacteraceae bacterium]
MSSRFNPILTRFMLPLALAAVAFVLAPHAPAHADAAPQQLTCGNVDLTSASSSDAAKAFDCFHNAFSHCDSATLVASGQAAGMPTTWTFVTVPRSGYGCSVSETIERGTGTAKTTDASLCTSVNRDKDELRFTGCANSKDVALRLSSAYGATSSQ